MSTELAHQSFVALTPFDVPQAQEGIADWCRAKIIALGSELREQRQNLRQAKAAKWKHLPWARLVAKTKARMVYYAKIAAAVKAGYLIVPNFDVQVMAVRVARAMPPRRSEDRTYDSVPSNIVTAEPQLLPPGAGRYVDGTTFHEHDSWSDTNAKGDKVTHHRYITSGYDAPDFPVLAVKPQVLDATQRAMALNIFDRIGVVTGRKQDPLVIGELMDPQDRWHRKRVSFFIAWWLDTRTL